MGKKILCISMIQDTVQYLEIDRQRAGFFAQTASIATSSEELVTACNRVDEIYINSSLPSAVYDWGTFPKVKKKYLQNLVNRSVQEKHGLTGALDVRFSVGKDVTVQDVVKSQVSYVAVEKEEIASLQSKFKHCFRKVKNIAPLPLALASVVSQTEKPEDHFAIVWFGENSTIISINTADGQVKLARNVPLRLPAGEMKAVSEKKEAAVDQDGPEEKADQELELSVAPGSLGLAAERDPFERFSAELDRELAMTFTFFKQNFRMKAPEELYILGNARIEDILGRYPLSEEELSIHFALSKSPVQGMSSGQINENIHLLANLFLAGDISFVPQEVSLERQADKVLRYAYVGVAALIVLAGLWSMQTQASRAASREALNSRIQERQDLQQNISSLQATIDRLSPIEARKNLYEKLYLNQPHWSSILNELAAKMPKEVVIDHFQVSSVGEDWKAKLNGEIRAKTWQEGLNIMREFGKTLHSSSSLDVLKVDYSRGGMEKLPRAAYSFQFDLQIFPGAE